MTTMRRRRVRFLVALLGTAVLLGLLQGAVLAALDQPAALSTWWGTALQALLAVGICFAVAQAVDRHANRP